jgi:hypothetical protein
MHASGTTIIRRFKRFGTLQKLSPKNNQLLYEKGGCLLALKDTVGAENSFNDF